MEAPSPQPDKTETIEAVAQPHGLPPLFAGRYEVRNLIAEGGMGAVFRVFDRQLHQEIALKTIKSDMASNAEVAKRFNQEVSMALRVTHKNVIRIFDMGESSGIKYLTMELVDGDDLHKLVRRRKAEGKPLNYSERARIMRDVARALEAAHEVGVIHRDLKPSNIMVDTKGVVKVMDFGLARPAETNPGDQGLTRVGQVLGTPRYMSPEQARDLPVDPRSDIFTFGVILYEMLTGVSPYKAETPMDSMIMRTHTVPVPPVNVAPDVPSELNAIAVGCLQIQPENRIQSATELAIWLDEFLHPSGTSTQLVATGIRTMAYSTAVAPVSPTMAMDAAPTVTTMMPVAAPPPVVNRRKWFLAAGGAVVAAGAGYGIFRYTQPAASTLKPGAPVTLLVADFVNNTGDPNLNGTMEPLLSLALEDSAFVNIFSRGAALRELAAVNAGADRIGGATAQLLARRLGVGLIIDGTIDGRDGKFEVKVRAVDPNGTVLKEAVATASKPDQLLTAVAKLAPELRQAFGDATPGSSAETYTTTSLEAAHAYARAQDLGFRGRFQESLVEYQRTISLDPSMGRAYAGMATVSRNAGQLAAAEDNFKQALSRIDRMTEREQYRTRGSYAITVENYRKAVEEFTQLVKKFPADNTGHGNLAVALLQIRDVDRALVEGREATRINPASLSQQNNVAYYLLYAGNFDGALRQAKLVTDKDPGYLKAHMVAALANLALGNVDAARASFERAGPSGALGLADIDFLEGSFQAVINRLSNSKTDAEQVVAAQAMLRLGDRRGAVALAEQVATSSKSLGALYQAALTLQAAGVTARARAIARQLGTRLGEGPQMYSNLIESECALAAGQTQEAVRFAADAQKMVDTWLGRYHLGRAYLQAKGYAEAQSEFDHCVRRAGEATGVFIDDLPTWRLMAPAYFYLAQSEEGLGSAGAKTSYQKFLNLAKNLPPNDPMAVQARRGIK